MQVLAYDELRRVAINFCLRSGVEQVLKTFHGKEPRRSARWQVSCQFKQSIESLRRVREISLNGYHPRPKNRPIKVRSTRKTRNLCLTPFLSMVSILFRPINAVAMHQGIAHSLFVSSRHFFVANKGTLDVESAVGHVGGHLLQLELLGELLVELLEFGDEFAAGLDNGGFGSDFAVGVDAELEGGEERVRDLVGREGDVLHAEQLVTQHVGERVVLFVEGEESGIGDLCQDVLAVCVYLYLFSVNSRVTVSISILRSPSARRNSSCLSGMSITGLTCVVQMGPWVR